METERICPNCRKPLPPDVPLGLCPECLIKSGFPTGTDPVAAVGARFVPPPVEEIARLFPQLEILGFIGKGGMGAVYKARQPALDRLVALKVLPPVVGDDPGFAERFNREARALARLNHPNIVAVHDFGKAGALPYLLMEFVDGTNLREVEQAGRLSPEQALAIIPQICEALQFAHNEGIVHRDIKPENLLLDKKGRLKITDFGIAKILGVPAGKISLTGARDVVGTPHYMAPEQIEKPQTVDHRADIYSMGVVFYEMLTGELPLGKFAPPSKKVQLDVRLDEVVLHTLEKEPERRYQQASQVKTDVETIATTAPPIAPALGFSAAAGTVPPASLVPSGQGTSDKVILPSFLLAFFFGVFGAHRFYAGKIRTAFLQLASLGGCVLLIIACTITDDYEKWQDTFGILLAASICSCLIWAAIDCILILCKAFSDGQGRRITQWVHVAPGAAKSASQAQGGKPPIPPAMNHKTSGVSGGMIIAPGIALMVAGILKLVSALKILLFFAWPGSELLNSIFSHLGIFSLFHWDGLIGSSTVLFKLVPALVIIFGGVEMIRVRNYVWAVVAAIVAIAFCSLVGLPAGIWALIILARADVREAFETEARSKPSPTTQWLFILAAAVIAGFLLTLMGVVFSLWPNTNQNFTESKWKEHHHPGIVAHQIPDNTNSTASLPDITVLKDNSTPKVNVKLPTNSLPKVAAVSTGDSTSNIIVAPAPKLVRENEVKADAVTNAIHQVIDVGDEPSFSTNLVVEPGGTLTMNVDRGDVHITGSDENTFEIHIDRDVTRASDEDAARILTEERLVLKQTGNNISITASDPPGLRGGSWWWDRPNLNVHYEITVPQKFEVQSETSGGNVKTTDIQGNVNIKTLGGNLDCEDIDGDVDGHTMGGNVRSVECKGQLRLETMGGGITIEKFTGPGIQATTEGGSVSADFAVAPKSDCQLHTSGGNVTAKIPNTAAVTLDAHTEGGSVRTDLPVQVEGKVQGSMLRGTINGGGPLLKLETAGGDIEILKR
jgi:DUF4097 and DUF4098 domain-containing protein YvlB/predicted Ser/Thr protein kinase